MKMMIRRLLQLLAVIGSLIAVPAHGHGGSGGVSAAASAGTVLSPLASKHGMPFCAALLVQEVGIDAGAYAELGRQLQQDAPFYLWVGLVDFPQDTPTSDLIDSYMSHMLSDLDALGFNKSDTRLLYAFGHGAGSFPMQDWAIKYVANQRKVTPLPAPLKGVVLLGSYLQRKHRNSTFPTGVMTMAGDMDGVTRITRIAESYYHLILHPGSPPINYGFPHIVLNGVSHMQFASGPPPPIAQELDLKPEQSQANATHAVTSISSAFMALKFEDVLREGDQVSSAEYEHLPFREIFAKARNLLDQGLRDADDVLTPIVESFEAEAFYHLHSPCYAKTDDKNCSSRSPWIETAQTLMCGLGASRTSVADRSILWPVNEVFPHDYLPKILNSCTPTDINCTLNTTSVVENVYAESDVADESLAPIAAVQQEVKFNSRQRCYEHAGITPADFNTTDGPSLCADINQAAYEQAVGKANAVNKARFLKYGQRLRMAPDKVTSIFPIWSIEPLQIDTSGTEALVTAWASKYSTQNPIPLVAGLHFCKLLSPARAMEWVYVDSLRKSHSLG
ncbi:uncharacterized protein LOC135812120 [Sycon ciliatum]|uniref:uncharacterized protein LOC135812120 n=1 Tax=Sycon ciliatum TaxID=27933 RepID=UPI0031F65EAD